MKQKDAGLIFTILFLAICLYGIFASFAKADMLPAPVPIAINWHCDNEEEVVGVISKLIETKEHPMHWLGEFKCYGQNEPYTVYLVEEVKKISVPDVVTKDAQVIMQAGNVGVYTAGLPAMNNNGERVVLKVYVVALHVMPEDKNAI